MGQVTRALAASCKIYHVRYTVEASCTYCVIAPFTLSTTGPTRFARRKHFEVIAVFEPLSVSCYERFFCFVLLIL